jgi:hypothetical protein
MVAGVLGRLDGLQPSGCGQVSDLPFFLLLSFSFINLLFLNSNLIYKLVFRDLGFGISYQL